MGVTPAIKSAKLQIWTCDTSGRVAATAMRPFAKLLRTIQRCSPVLKRSGGRLKQDFDKDLQLHRILILLY